MKLDVIKWGWLVSAAARGGVTQYPIPTRGTLGALHDLSPSSFDGN